jgi:hypothetical protein
VTDHFRFVNGQVHRVIELNRNLDSLLAWLPEEVVMIILSNLSVQDIVVVSRVNNTFLRICNKPLLWRFNVKRLCVSNNSTGLFKTFDKRAQDRKDVGFDWKKLYQAMITWKQSDLELSPIKIGEPTDSLEETEFFQRPNEHVLDIYSISRNRFVSVTNSSVTILTISENSNYGYRHA